MNSLKTIEGPLKRIMIVNLWDHGVISNTTDFDSVVSRATRDGPVLLKFEFLR